MNTHSTAENSSSDSPVVFITGSLKRIGLAIACAFARCGWRVILHGRTASDTMAIDSARSALTDAAPNMPFNALFGDLTDVTVTSELIKNAINQYGRLDCLVNNASVYQRSPMGELSANDIHTAYEINCWIPFSLMQDYRRLSPKGSVINILDQRIEKIDCNAGAYALAKKTLRDITLACAAEWAPCFRINAVAPGIVLPPPGIASDQGLKRMSEIIPMKTITPTDDIAQACLFLAGATSITGQILFVDGGLHLTADSLGEPKTKRTY